MPFLQVLSVLKIEKGSQMLEDYSKSFREAVAVFQHARMWVHFECKYAITHWPLYFTLLNTLSRYDADTKMLKHLKPLTEDLLLLDGELDFLGPYPFLTSVLLLRLSNWFRIRTAFSLGSAEKWAICYCIYKHFHLRSLPIAFFGYNGQLYLILLICSLHVCVFKLLVFPWPTTK